MKSSKTPKLSKIINKWIKEDHDLVNHHLDDAEEAVRKARKAFSLNKKDDANDEVAKAQGSVDDLDDILKSEGVADWVKSKLGKKKQKKSSEVLGQDLETQDWKSMTEPQGPPDPRTLRNLKKSMGIKEDLLKENPFAALLKDPKITQAIMQYLVQSGMIEDLLKKALGSGGAGKMSSVSSGMSTGKTFGETKYPWDEDELNEEISEDELRTLRNNPKFRGMSDEQIVQQMDPSIKLSRISGIQDPEERMFGQQKREFGNIMNKPVASKRSGDLSLSRIAGIQDPEERMFGQQKREFGNIMNKPVVKNPKLNVPAASAQQARRRPASPVAHPEAERIMNRPKKESKQAIKRELEDYGAADFEEYNTDS